MKTKILIVEHNLSAVSLIQQELNMGCVNYISKMVRTENEYEKALHNFKPDIIISNYFLPSSFEGITAFELKEKLAPQTPFIFVAKDIDLENAIKLIKIGVTDLVLAENISSLTDKVNCALKQAKYAVFNQSEKKRTEELWQNEAKFQALYENSVDGILLTVTDGQILAANPAACKIFKRTEQEIIDGGRFGLVDNSDPRLKSMIAERQRTGWVTGEITLVYKDGSKFPGELTAAVYNDKNGERRTSMIVRNISERKEAAQKLAQSANDLQQALHDRNKILDSTLDVICSFDEEGRFVSVNAASEYLWGYKPEELMGKKYIDFVFHEDIEKTRKTDISIKSGLPVTVFENRYIKKDGCVVPILWSSRWDEKGKKSYAIAKDATDKQNLEKAFEIERQRFHDLYSQAPSCMGILKGPNHVYELANELYLQLIDRTDIIGKTVKEVLPELESQGIFVFLDTVYQTGETFSANEMLVQFDHHGNGKLVDTYLNFIYQAHRGTDNNIDGILFFANDVTEQVLSRKKIEESVLRYSSLIEQASDAICIIDVSMKITDVNHYACLKSGYSREEILQLSLEDFFLAEDLMANPLKLDALKEGKTVRDERRIKRKDGTLIDVELSAKMLKDGNTILFGRDMTDHKKAQRALMESEKKYRQIVETAQEGIWLIDENHKTTFVNDKMCQILEYTQKEMIGKEIFYFMDEEGKQLATKLMEGKKAGKSDNRTFKYISKSGKEIWANVAANPFISETGEYKGGMAMVADITKIKKAEHALKENEKKYRYLFENNPMPMWITELNTFKFLDVNKMAVLQYGYSREEFLSMTAIDVRPQQHKESFTEFNDSLLYEPENFYKGIWNHQKKNGTVFPVEIIAHEIIYEGVPARFILSNDITDRRKAELNLEKRNKELIKTNSELDRFVYSVSHDLRSPLTSVLGLLSFIETESLEADTLEHAGMIRDSINRLDDFIKNILSYSQNNRSSLEIEKILLQQTVIDVVESLQSMKQAQGIVFDIDVKEHYPFYSDRQRFKTIIENLISNAIKHHKNSVSGRYIKITGRYDNDKLQLTIADNGIGIAPENHQKIFDMFVRLSGKTDGSGIGLYIVMETIEKLEGSIEVKSELETGTTFIITLKNLKP